MFAGFTLCVILIFRNQRRLHEHYDGSNVSSFSYPCQAVRDGIFESGSRITTSLSPLHWSVWVANPDCGGYAVTPAPGGLESYSGYSRISP